MPYPNEPSIVQTDENPCSDLLEFMLFVPQGPTTTDFLLGAEVRFGPMTVYLDDYQQYVEFGLSKAILKLRPIDCQILPGTRHADKSPSVPIRTDVKISLRAASQSGVGITGKLAGEAGGFVVPAIAAQADLGVSKKKQTSTSQIEDTTFTKEYHPIVSLSGNRWQFSALSQRILFSKMLGDEHLCKIAFLSDDAEIGADLSFFPKDIVIFDGEAKGIRISELLGRSPNRAAVAKALLAKQLKDLNRKMSEARGATAGEIVGSRSTLLIERPRIERQ